MLKSYCVALAAASLIPVPALAQPPASTPTIPGLVEIPRLKLVVRDFVVVTQVILGSPADKAGLKANDVLLGLENKWVTTATAYVATTKALPTNTTLHVKVRRGRTLVDCNIAMDAWDAANTLPSAERGRTGLGLQNRVIAQKVDSTSGAGRMGIGAGDEILLAANVRTDTAAQLAEAVASLPKDQPVQVLFKRAGERVAARLSPEGTASLIPADTLYAASTKITTGTLIPVSALVTEARKGTEPFRSRNTGKKTPLAGIVSQVFPRSDGVAILLNATGNHDTTSTDSVWVEAKNGPVADALKSLKPGTILYVTATLTRASQEQEDKPFTVNSAEFLDGKPTTPQKLTTVTLTYTADAIL